MTSPTRTSFLRSDVYRAIILATALAGSIFLTAHVSYNPPPPKTFSFLETVPANGSSITVSDVTGSIFAASWSQPQVLINGSIVVTGEGATPDNVQIQENNVGGSIYFRPSYFDRTLGRGYLVDVNLYLPSKTSFASIGLQAVDAGVIHLGPLNDSHISVETWAGNITMALNPNPSGDYSIATHNGGNINLKVPETSSFTLQAVSGLGYYGQVTVHGFDQCQVDLSPARYMLGNTRATITCSDHTANVEVNTDYTVTPQGGYITVGDITVSSV